MMPIKNLRRGVGGRKRTKKELVFWRCVCVILIESTGDSELFPLDWSAESPQSECNLKTGHKEQRSDHCPSE